MSDKYIDQFAGVKSSSIQFRSKCPKCDSESWKSASLIYIESKSPLSKLCAPPVEPKKPRKPLPKIIRVFLGIIVALLFFLLGFYLLANTGNVGEYLGVLRGSHPLIQVLFLVVYVFPLLMLFFNLIVESVKAGFRETDYEDRLEKFNTFTLPKYKRTVETYPYLRICMRCGEQFLGRSVY